MTKSFLCIVAISGALLSPQRLLAQDAYDARLFAAADNMEFVGGLDFLTAYYFRGILQK